MTQPAEQPAEAPPPPAGSRLRRIGVLALPIIAGMMSQTVLGLVDAAMVGSLGEVALAAVGQGNWAALLGVAPLLGLAPGVQAMAARRLGEQKHAEVAVPLNGGLLLALLAGVPLTALLVLLSPVVFPLLNGDPAVVAEGVPYLQLRLSALAAVGMTAAFRGYMNGVDLSRLYLYTQVITHVLNIAISWCLIFGRFGLPELGVVGAGLGTAISLWIGTAVYFGMAWVYARDKGFLRERPGKETLQTLARLGTPFSMEQAFTMVSMTVLFLIIARIGTAEVAAATVLMNLVMVAVVPGMGLGVATATLVGQSLGRKQPDEARRWAWEVARIGVVALGIIGLPMILVPELLLRPFLWSSPEALQAGLMPLRLVGLGAAADGVGMVLMFALLGAGASKTVMRTSMGLQTLTLGAAWIAGPVLGFGLTVVWAVYVAQRFLLAGAFATWWERGAWRGIRV